MRKSNLMYVIHSIKYNEIKNTGWNFTIDPKRIDEHQGDWYLWIYVTAKKPNFSERFRADNGKNRNIPEGNLSNQTIK